MTGRSDCPSAMRRKPRRTSWRSTTGAGVRHASTASAVQDLDRRPRDPFYPRPFGASLRDAADCHSRMIRRDRRVSQGIRTTDQLHRDGGGPAGAFHVVCPSLPGYGSSDKPGRAVWNVPRIAKAWSELMSRLDYKRYVAQGEDWGAATTCIGLQDTANCLGIHVNMPLILHLLVRFDPASKDLTEAEKSALAGAQYYND
jgi:hypothetical protein